MLLAGILLAAMLYVQNTAAAPVGESAPPPSALTLWYRQPAREWVEALPVGNGRLGAMVFGGAADERIQLNEDTVWSGGVRPAMPASIARELPAIRQLLFDGDFAAGEARARQTLLAIPDAGGSYQTLGDLLLSMEHAQEPRAYRRALDLDSGIATTSFEIDGVAVRRDVFASAPDNAIIVRLSADQPHRLTLGIALERTEAAVRPAAPSTLVLTNLARTDPGVKFAAVVRAAAEGGRVEIDGTRIKITGATAVTLAIAAATNFNRRDPFAPLTRDVEADAIAAAEAAIRGPYDRVKQRALDDHRRLFRRVSLELGATSGSDRPTDERLAAVQRGALDPALAALYFQYGRYLLIGSSRPGGMPANLQGLWNKELQAPWSADYHININIQMNYWPAEVTNLSECAMPLFDFVEALADVSGRRIATDFYGARGFMAHYTTNAWLISPDTGQPKWAMWQMGGAWTTRHFIEHYWYTGDRAFLKDRALPILRDAALFLLDWLVPDPRSGKLVSGPSASPENTFIAEDGGQYSVAMGNSMDQEIAWDTFSNYLAAARELDISDDTTARVRAALDRVAWPGIGRDGRVMEWAREFKEAEPGHRHMSQLFGLHPGHQFTSAATPAYMDAARRTIDARLAHGGGHTGWSRAWIVNFFARLRDGERAHENIQALLAKSTLPNLFDNHPPFQIDGNFGGTAGIAEMLLQSHDGEIALLPALPKAWPNGRFTGLRARGGFDVAVAWTNGVPDVVTITSSRGGTTRVRFGATVRDLTTAAGQTYTLRGAALDAPR